MSYLDMLIPPQTLETMFLGNSVRAYVTAAIVFLVALLVFRIFQSVLLNRLSAFSERTATELDNVFIDIVRTVQPPFYMFVAFYVALEFVTLHPVLETIVNIALLIWVVYLSIGAVQKLVNYVVRKHVQYETHDAARSAARFVSGLIKWVLWAIGGLLILSNLGVNITSLIAGLGIGGVAIAFALQNILGDLFSSFAIYFDKPFVVGDVIKVGEFIGEVQKIGIKTTRVKALQGEEVIFSNNQLTSDVVQNFGRLQERRSVFTLSLGYDMPQETLERVPEMIENIITEKEDARFDRAHFISFGDSGLEVEVALYIAQSQYGKFLDVLERINFDIRRKFKEEGISLTYPTRTIHLKREQ